MTTSDIAYPLLQLRHLSEIPITNGLGESGDPRNDASWPRYIRTTDIDTVRSLDPSKRVTLPPDIAAQAVVDQGDILMSSAGSVGKSYLHVTGESACFAGYLSRWRVRRDRADPEFMAYWTESTHFLDQVLSGAVKSTIENYSAAKYRATWAPAPALEMQTQVVAYLDRETAQIDAFIAKNEELITLLTERRNSVITAAITGGLCCSSERVDSGVDWIGAVPSHWEVRPLRWSARIRTGTTPSGASVFADEPGQPWIRPDDLDVSGAPSVASRWLTEGGASQGRPAAAGATLVCTIGATLGKAGRVTAPSYFNQQITEVKWALNDELLFWIFVAAREAVARLAVGNTLPILNNDKLATLRIPVPPLAEQAQIVDHVEEQTTRIDGAIATARRGVDLMRERRAALISAAVTGKIDVGVAA